MKKQIKIKVVDRSNRRKTNKQSTFLETNFTTFIDVIMEILRANYDVEEDSRDPDYVFCLLPVGNAKGYEYFEYRDKVLCQIILENARPDFTCFDYAIGCFHNFSYGNHYCYLPGALCSTDQPREAYSKVLTKHHEIDPDLARRAFCSFVVSNGVNAASERETIFHVLNGYKKVDSGGAFLNNVGGRVADRVSFESGHKFSIAFENAFQSMITEKLDMAFAARTVPIYWGNTDVLDVYNEGSFINCHDYPDFNAVLEEVIRLDKDPDAYLKYLATPAYRNPKSKEKWYAELEAFLINMIETPKEKAIIRTDTYWSNILQNMRYEAFKRYYDNKNRNARIRKTLGAAFRPFTQTALAKSVKRKFDERVY